MDISIDRGAFAYVPVPPALLADVMGFLSERLSSQVGQGSGEEEEIPSAEADFWTLDRLSLLRNQLHHEGSKTALNLAAREAPRPVPISRVEQETPSRSAREIAADLGALTKLCRKLFQRRAWPMRAVEMWTEDEDRWCMHYVMSTEVAERWNSLGDLD